MLVTTLMLAGLSPARGTTELVSQVAEPTRVAQLPLHPLMLLPGMQAHPAPAASAFTPSALPEPLISDVINAPNPFDSRRSGIHGMTQLSYTLAHDSPVTVTLYDLFGHRVREWSFRPGEQGGREGSNQLLWDGTNASGQKVSKGGYLAQIEVESNGTIATVLRKIGVIH